jgi:enterochelin esterase-like enzyme/sugar lactone lactonase YvrE
MIFQRNPGRRSTLWITMMLAAAASSIAWAQPSEYRLGPDSQFNPAVPHGMVTHHVFTAQATSLFAGTRRDYWVYVPQQYSPTKPACLMVFQDGGGYVSTNGSFRAPIVFDNLIARGEMPVTVGVFINPGVLPSALGTNALPRYNRSYEYDALGDRYARFLAEEFLPEVRKSVAFTDDPNGRAIAGASSGAIAAFTAAWERPDLFRRVFSTIGTYVGLRGGNAYPILIRKTEPKPLRVFLQDGSNDQNIYGGNWWIANLDMHSALEFSGYELEKAWGTGGHDSKQAGSIFPDALRWLWKNYPAPVKAGEGSRQPLTREVLAAGESWLAVTTETTGRVRQLWADQDGTVMAETTHGLLRLDDSPGMPLTGSEARRLKRVFSTPTAASATRADGHAYRLDPAKRKLSHQPPFGRLQHHNLTGLEIPTSLCLSPDQTLLYVADRSRQLITSFQVGRDGTPTLEQPYFHLHLPDDADGSGVGGLCVDTAGRLYAATPMGIQVFDQAGRVNGIIAPPQRLTNIQGLTFGGPTRDELYLLAEGRVWRRKVQTRGVFPAATPILPAPPRL